MARVRVVLLPGLSTAELRTPLLLLHTKGAGVPHLTGEALETLETFAGAESAHRIYQIPLLTTHHMQTGVKMQGEGVSAFAGLQANTYMTFHDPAAAVPSAPMEKYTVPLWSRMGKLLYDADRYMDTVEAFKPTIYEALNDAVTDADSPKKRISKSVERSKYIFTQCLERHKASKYLKENSLIFAPIGGGYSIDERKNLLKHILHSVDDIGGFVLDGLALDHIESLSYESIKDVVETVTDLLPDGKLRSARGSWNALTAIDLVLAGWDIFDTSMPFLATERGSALIFSFNLHTVDNSNGENLYELDLLDQKYKEDLNPILKDCQCPTCRNHTKAYINHLLNTKELLAGVLLMMHNLHHYLEYFKAIRESISSNTIQLLRDNIAKQYETHPIVIKSSPQTKVNKKARVL